MHHGPPNGLLQPVDGQLRFQPRFFRVADDASGVDSFTAGVELGVGGEVLGDAGQPQLVEGGFGEVPFDQGGIVWWSGILVRPHFFENTDRKPWCWTRFSSTAMPFSGSTRAMNRIRMQDRPRGFPSRDDHVCISTQSRHGLEPPPSRLRCRRGHVVRYCRLTKALLASRSARSGHPPAHHGHSDVKANRK